MDVIPGTPRLPAGRKKAGSRVGRQRRVPAFPDKTRLRLSCLNVCQRRTKTAHLSPSARASTAYFDIE